MDKAAILGVAWGFLAAAVQYGCLEWSIRGALRTEKADPSIRIAWSLVGSMVRLLVLTVMFLAAWSWDGIRLDLSAIAFAGFHLLFMLRLGFKLKTRLSPPNA